MIKQCLTCRISTPVHQYTGLVTLCMQLYSAIEEALGGEVVNDHTSFKYRDTSCQEQLDSPKHLYLAMISLYPIAPLLLNKIYRWEYSLLWYQRGCEHWLVVQSISAIMNVCESVGACRRLPTLCKCLPEVLPDKFMNSETSVNDRLPHTLVRNGHTHMHVQTYVTELEKNACTCKSMQQLQGR